MRVVIVVKVVCVKFSLGERSRVWDGYSLSFDCFAALFSAICSARDLTFRPFVPLLVVLDFRLCFFPCDDDTAAWDDELPNNQGSEKPKLSRPIVRVL